MKYCLALLLLSGGSIFGSARTIRISDRPSETSGQPPADAAPAALLAAGMTGNIFQAIGAASDSSAGSPAGSGDSSGESTPARKRSVVSPTGTPSPVKPQRKLTSPIPLSETDRKLSQSMSATWGSSDHLSRPFGRPFPGRPVLAQPLPSMSASASAAATGNLPANPMQLPLLALEKAVTDRPASAVSISRASNHSTDSDEQPSTPVYNTPAFTALNATAPMSVPPAPLLTARNSARPNTPATTARVTPQSSAHDAVIAKLRAEIFALKTKELSLRQLLADREETLVGQDSAIKQLMKASEQQQGAIGAMSSSYDQLMSKYTNLKRTNHGQQEEIIALRKEIARLSAIYCQDQHTPRRIHITPPPAAGAAAAASAPVHAVAPPDPTPFAALVALVEAGTVEAVQRPVAAASPLLAALPNPNPSNQVMRLRMDANAAASASAVDDDLFKL